MTHPRQKSAGKNRTLVSWSGGKDAAMALWRLQQSATCEVVGLVSTLNEATGRMPIHGVSEKLLKRQADELGLPLALLPLPANCPNPVYEDRLAALLFESRRDLGVEAVAFGDLFLKDIRQYREAFLKRLSLEPLFPLWGSDTAALAQEILSTGFRGKVVSVWKEKIDEVWLGQDFNQSFLQALQKQNDPCGEKGEFHTFTCQGPNFKNEITVTLGAIHTEGTYRWIDLN